MALKSTITTGTNTFVCDQSKHRAAPVANITSDGDLVTFVFTGHRSGPDGNPATEDRDFTSTLSGTRHEMRLLAQAILAECDKHDKLDGLLDPLAGE